MTPICAQRMTVDGEPLDPPPGLALMLHKPLGVTCSHKEAGPLVYDLLPERWRRRDPAISTDRPARQGDLRPAAADRRRRPAAPDHLAEGNVAKRYRVDPRPAAERRRGGDLRLRHADAGGRGQAAAAGGDRRSLTPTHAAVTFTEGRYHQVRRMFAAVGNHVDALHRDGCRRPGPARDLDPGGHRILQPQEVACLFEGHDLRYAGSEVGLIRRETCLRSQRRNGLVSLGR